MTDGDLIAQIKSGDEDAATILVSRYYDMCWRYSMRVVGNRADAEDLVQETFLRAIRSLDRYEERQQFQAWLFSILANRCRSRIKQLKRAERHIDPESLMRVPPALITYPEEEVNSQADGVILKDALQEALDRLSYPYREAFLLKHGEGMEYSVMEEVIGANISALKMRVKRARELLRGMLERRFYDSYE